MNKILDKSYENSFLKDVEQYVDAYEILISSDYTKEAYSYALCFYASFIGFLHAIYSNDRIVTTMTLNTLSIDPDIIPDLNNYIYSKDLIEDKNSNSVYYCYNKAIKISYEHIEYVIDSFLKLHNRIATSSKITTNEKKKIEETKKLIYAIKPSLKTETLY